MIANAPQVLGRLERAGMDMKWAWQTLALVAALTLSASASQVTRTDTPNTPREPVKALVSFDVSMSPNSSAQLADNLKFDAEALRAMLQRTLDSKQLVAADGDFVMKVVVDDIRVRSTFNAVFWGLIDSLGSSAVDCSGDRAFKRPLSHGTPNTALDACESVFEGG